MPSTVSIFCPSTSAASTKHESTILSFIDTVHAPQLPSKHPSLLPVRPTISLSASNKLTYGSVRNSSGLPFIVVLTLTAFYLLNFFGYALTTIFWMFGVGYFAGEKSVKKLLVFSLVVVFMGYIIFWQILSVQLPLGSFEKYLGLDFFLYG